MELMKASRQWASRPDDERFTSLVAMRDHFVTLRDNSRAVMVPGKALTVVPDEKDHQALSVRSPNGHDFAPTNWAFGQLASRVGAPASYLRTLPAAIAADNLNYGLQFNRDIEDVNVLVERSGTLRAMTGPKYGRVWNSDVVGALTRQFGDGVTGDWRVPGEFGRAVQVTKANTTLYAGDRDMFVFLADETNRIEVPRRRNGEAGSMARGFFVWNSEVGASTFGLGTFLFDYVCCNRIVWGAENYQEVRIRHTSGAPDRWLGEVLPALETYRQASDKGITQAITDARNDTLNQKVSEFLANRFGPRVAVKLNAIHELEEARPIETRWDAVVAATALARGIPHQNDRVELERQAGDLLKIA